MHEVRGKNISLIDRLALHGERKAGGFQSPTNPLLAGKEKSSKGNPRKQ